jgi:hypothetical protein
MIGKALLISLLLISIWLVSPLIQFGAVDPMALVVGVVAIWFVWEETCRNNTPIVKVTKCEGSGQQSVYENNGKFFQQLRITVHNRGISLWNVGVAVEFWMEDRGSMRWFLSPHVDENSPPPNESPGGPVEFARGMVAEYSIKSYKCTRPGIFEPFFRLKDAGKQQAGICVFSQGNLAYRVRVGGGWDRLKSRWNRFAHSINSRFDKTIEQPGEPCPLLVEGGILPTFFVLEHGIMSFVRGLKSEQQLNAAGTAGHQTFPFAGGSSWPSPSE